MSIDEKRPAPDPTPNDVEKENPMAAPQASATPQPDPNEPARPRRRGFAAMDRDRVKAIASKGGRAAHAAGTAHQFSADEARVAGKKGGEAPHVRRGGVRRRPPTNDAPPTSQDHGRDEGR